MNELKPTKRTRVPFTDWLLFVTNFTWAYALFRVLFHPPADPDHLQGLKMMAWFGIVATAIVFGIRVIQKKNAASKEASSESKK